MATIRQVKFDILGTDPTNTIVGETIKLTDKTCPWVIPDGAPFFAEAALMTVKNAAGDILVPNRDYFMEEEFVPFCEVTGRSIKCFLRLPQNILNANTHIKIDYQSIGAFFLPRSDMEAWLSQIYRASGSVSWDQVSGVPDVFPIAQHRHNIKTEIADWNELSWFFAYLEKVTLSRDPAANDRVTTQYRLAFNRLTSAKTTRLAQLKAHDEDYNVPHGTTKFDILLGNHANYPTATLAEDLEGVRKDALSTPMGVAELAKAYAPNTDEAMLRGIMPLSRFGGDSFIPPNIAGSFEGMGQQTECSGICLEQSGVLMLLSNHMDGRSQGLYYSTVENYNNANIKITYTNYKYQPPILQALGKIPDRIISGSGNKVIMVGLSGTNDWYIALTNNTFDHTAHNYVRCDMTALFSKFGAIYGNSPTSGNPERATIHHMGTYLVLIQAYNESGIPKSRFYRVLTEDVRAGRPVAWELISLTYVDYEGVQWTNSPEFGAQRTTRDANNKILSFGRYTAVQPFNSVSIFRRESWLSWEKSDSPGSFYLHSHQYFHLSYSDPTAVPPYGQVIGCISEMFYILNPATGVMSLQFKSPEVVVDFLPGYNTVLPVDEYRFMSNNLVAFGSPATVILPTGEMASSHVVEGASLFPVRLQIISFVGIDSGEALLANSMSTKVLTVKRSQMTAPIVAPATKNGGYPSSLIYEPDGELFEAVDPLDPSYRRQAYFRKVTGSYTIRTGVNNLSLGNVYSRPLTMDIYKANLLRGDGVVGLTGSAAEYQAAGVEMGSSSLSYCAYSTLYTVAQHLPTNTALRAPVSGNVAVSFPRTYTKTLDPAKKEANYVATSFYGFRQNVIDQIKAYAIGATRFAFSIVHLGEENGGMFRNLNLSIIFLTWITEGNARYRSQVFIARPVVEEPNADHPGVHLITEYTMLHAPGDVSPTRTLVLNRSTQFRKFDSSSQIKPYLSGYRTSTGLKVIMTAAHGITPVASDHVLTTIFDLDLSTNQIVNLAAGVIGKTGGEVAVMWPNVGMTDVDILSNSPELTRVTYKGPQPYVYTGGAASIHNFTGKGYIMPASVYPETGWVLFCQPNIRMMVNGSMYAMPGGNIDLRDIDIAPQNKTFYVYATVEDDAPKYIITTAKLRKSGNMLKAATVVTNSQQIISITRHQPLMVGQYLLSYSREGGTIPMSTGFPQDEGDFFFLKNAELLP